MLIPNKENVLNSEGEPKDSSIQFPSDPTRKGNYSGIGYSSLESPRTQAERWNMPFTDPEFAYEPLNDELH